LDFNFIPLVFKAGYALPLYKGFGLKADLGAGFMLSRVSHYESAVDMIQDNKQESRGRSLITLSRVYGTYTFTPGWLNLYLGGGADVLLEDAGIIPLPLLSGGITVRPFRHIRPRERQPHAVASPVYAHAAESILIDSEDEQAFVRFFKTVYFEPDSAAVIERYLPVLIEAGELLTSNPGLVILLRAYAAPFGSPDRLMTLSASRAMFCADYLIRYYGLSEERIIIEYFGSDRAPEFINSSWESWRCVELIIEE
jgi:flagellar motor protein MotB